MGGERAEDGNGKAKRLGGSQTFKRRVSSVWLHCGTALMLQPYDGVFPRLDPISWPCVR